MGILDFGLEVLETEVADQEAEVPVTYDTGFESLTSIDSLEDLVFDDEPEVLDSSLESFGIEAEAPENNAPQALVMMGAPKPKKPVLISRYELPTGGKLYRGYIVSGTDAKGTFDTLIALLEGATAADEFNIKLGWVAGRTHEWLAMLSAIERCRAKVRVDLGCGIGLGAAMVCTVADEVSVNDFSSLRFNEGEMVGVGTGKDAQQMLQASEKVLKRMHDHLISVGLVTEDEWVKVTKECGTLDLRGEDLVSRFPLKK